MYGYWQHRRLPMQDTPPREEYEEGRFFIEPVVAWRAWKIVRENEGLVLRSVTFSVPWPEREPLLASCQRITKKHHRCPSLECGCGIHAVKSEEQAREWLQMGFHPELVAKAIGTVSLWGRVLCYTKGYLAEKAYPKAVVLDEPRPEVEAWLSEGFGVEVS